MAGDKTRLAITILGKGKGPAEASPSSDEGDGEAAAAGDLYDALVAEDRGAFTSALSNLWEIYMAKMMMGKGEGSDEESY
jgi:hypothetical protein